MVLNWQSTTEASQQTGHLIPNRRYLALHLPRWATDCLKRADPALAVLPTPLVLHERQKGVMRLVAVDEPAAEIGLYRGQNLSDARAICPNLESREVDHDLLASIFADFADWHSYVSPIVAISPGAIPYGDLIIDITGVAHLFGGETSLFETVIQRLTALGFQVHGAIADSVGAAWALSHFAPNSIINGGLEACLAKLPMAALRLDDSQISGLMQMGLKQIGQLYRHDRKALHARFGLSLLTRLDQATGLLEERIMPRIPIAERYAERRFAEPICLLDDVLMCARDLSVQLAVRLETEGLGAQAFHLFLYRVDHKVMTLSVNAARATRDATHISRLFSHRVDRLIKEYDPGFGIDMIRLAVSSVDVLSSSQIGVFATNDGTINLDQLYDRMSSRLGPFAIVRSKFINSHIPERAIKLEPVIARTDDNPVASALIEAARPLRLLPIPEPIAVTAEIPHGPPASMIWHRQSYRFIKSSGPERIGVEWWTLPNPISEPVESSLTGHPILDEASATRDYYTSEDTEGRRYWLFREGLYNHGVVPRWFLHGFFA